MKHTPKNDDDDLIYFVNVSDVSENGVINENHGFYLMFGITMRNDHKTYPKGVPELVVRSTLFQMGRRNKPRSNH